jgi:RHS repeat-associated protein
VSYLNARYYQAGQGQFISQDPGFLTVGDPRAVQQIMGYSQLALLSNPQQLNAYSYGLNNPITNKDPLGLWAASYNFLSASAEGGFGSGGAGSANLGLTFVSGPDGGLALTSSYGAAGTFGQRSVSYPSASSVGSASNRVPFVLGASAGVGCGVPQCGYAFQLSGSYAPTVNNLSDLNGPSDPINATLQYGSFSQQTDAAGNITDTFSIKGLGRGASVSRYPIQNSSSTLVSTRSVLNAARGAYSSAQASYEAVISKIQAQLTSLQAQIANFAKSRSAKL